MKREKKNHTVCQQSIVLQHKIDRQQEVLKEASDTIMENVNQTLSLAKIKLATTDIHQPEVAESKIQTSHDIVGKAIIDLRLLRNHITEVMNEDEEYNKNSYESGTGDKKQENA